MFSKAMITEMGASAWSRRAASHSLTFVKPNVIH